MESHVGWDMPHDSVYYRQGMWVSPEYALETYLCVTIVCFFPVDLDIVLLRAVVNLRNVSVCRPRSEHA